MSLANAFSGIALAFSDAFSGPFHRAQIITPGQATYDTGGSIIAPAVPSRRDCRAQVDAASEAMRRAEGFVEADRRILVLADTLAGAITTADRIEFLEGPFAGVWMIESVGRDSAALGFELRGRRG